MDVHIKNEKIAIQIVVFAFLNSINCFYTVKFISKTQNPILALFKIAKNRVF